MFVQRSYKIYIFLSTKLNSSIWKIKTCSYEMLFVSSWVNMDINMFQLDAIDMSGLRLISIVIKIYLLESCCVCSNYLKPLIMEPLCMIFYFAQLCNVISDPWWYKRFHVMVFLFKYYHVLRGIAKWIT